MILPAGFSISPADLDDQVKTYIATNRIPGWANFGAVISALKTTSGLRWASPLEVKNAVENAFLGTFGPKEAAKRKEKVRER